MRLAFLWMLFACIGATNSRAQESGSSSVFEGPHSAAPLIVTPSQPFIRATRPLPPPKVQWRGLFIDSMLYLTTEHAFRIADDPRVRENLREGPFFGDYARSVANIRGWNDGDDFRTNYVGHPIDGAIASYIFSRHDPKHYSDQFGRRRQYWTGVARAMGFSAAYSLQFEIGPFSEASIGNVQLRPNSRGVVDWVITPTLGTVWRVGEDAMDRMVIQKIEGAHQQSSCNRPRPHIPESHALDRQSRRTKMSLRTPRPFVVTRDRLLTQQVS